MSIGLAHSRLDIAAAPGRSSDVLAAGLSVLLHVALLVGVGVATWSRVPPPPETVEVMVEMVSAPAEPAPPAVAEVQPAPPVETQPVAPAPPPPKPRPIVIRHGPSQAITATPARPSSVAAPVAASLPSKDAPASPPLSAVPPAPTAATAEANIGRYLADIQGKVAARLRYPPQALRRGEQGLLHVHLTLSRNGDLLNASTDDASSPSLREAALQAVRDCLPFPPLPLKPPTEQAELVIPVAFTIR
jgi:protein TonB